MSFCSKCGKRVEVDAIFCGSCGNRVAPNESKAISQEAVFMPPNQNMISDSWQKRFKLIEKAGGSKLPQIKKLNFGERMNVSFNVWGFLFGPFYYLTKGMWKKAITLVVLSVLAYVVIAAILEAMKFNSTILNFLSALIFASRANIDFYKKMTLNNDEWL